MSRFELLLFTVDPKFAQRAVAAGVDGIVVDWEYRGKAERQRGADTQINQDTVEDLIRVRGATDARIVVRISQYGAATVKEIDQAVDGGADEILLPMVETVGEVRRTLELARSRVKVGILIETVAAVAIADRLGGLPLCRVYVGLNDLSIQRGTPGIFSPLIDGTLETVSRAIQVPFGFGGLTMPDRGRPLPCRLLMREMARMGSSFSFLRRSFLRDSAACDLKEAVRSIREGLEIARRRGPIEMAADRRALVQAVLAAERGVVREMPVELAKGH